MCRAKEISEKLKAKREEEKKAKHKWFIDKIEEEMVSGNTTKVEFTNEELHRMYEDQGHKYNWCDTRHELNKEGFDVAATVDYEKEPYGVVITLKSEYMFEVK